MELFFKNGNEVHNRNAFLLTRVDKLVLSLFDFRISRNDPLEGVNWCCHYLILGFQEMIPWKV
jgi:hypothetical protein